MPPKKLIALLIAVVLPAAPWGCSDPEEGAPERKDVSPAQPASRSVSTARGTAEKLIDGGIEFLLSRREADGGWSLGHGAAKPAVTAMVLKALLQHRDYNTASPLVKQGFDVLLSYRQKDGGIYDPSTGLANYTSSLALMAMTSAKNPRFAGDIRAMVAYLKGRQIVAGSRSPKGKIIGADHPWRGGAGYGTKHDRPDGSNTGMWAQALHDAGVKGDDPAMVRMLGFFTRLQNRSESNPTAAWARQGPDDGGFVYAFGESKAGIGPGGRGLRSYGSLTYMGFKSMLYAGLSRDDPRVRAALEWIGGHWTLESNPNMPQAISHEGLYYYYHVYAKALRAWGEEIIVDSSGAEHHWREELIDALARRVRSDGSWVNEKAKRWNEGSAVLATCYAVLSLQEATK
ncbi:MAG: terpene cyclase/mutase family protein [Planctomycetes bacterium]|nr:terpene cyclase/mutase family protein [Planctomycetota bacterium]